MPRYFMSYATANEGNFFADYLNFKRLSRFDPGVPVVDLFMAVSTVRPQTAADRGLTAKLMRLASRNPRIRGRSIEFKGNIGRDFSSAAANLARIAEIADDEDYILFVNRSGYGPFMDQWYRSYVGQLEQSGAQLVGTSINFRGHPGGLTEREFHTHVQTYAYAGRMGLFRPLVGNFPAQAETDRVRLIDAGEVGLSHWVLQNGGAISCLAWPQHVFTKESAERATLPQEDVKRRLEGLPFLYKRGLRRQLLGRLGFELWRGAA